MIRSVSARYAFRSLFRHPRRTVLSVAGIGVGCAIALVAISWISGSAEMQIRATAESGAGHLRVVPQAWLATRANSLRLAQWREAAGAVAGLPGVRVAALRARANALLALGNRTAGVEIVGVQPEAEARLNRIVRRAEIEGRYLQPEDENRIVIGRALAQRLDVGLDDELYVTLSGRDEIRSAMLIIVGVIATGSRELDTSIAHTTLETLNEVTGYEGPGEICMLLEDYELIDARREQLAGLVPPGNAVITWKQVSPGIAANVEGDRAFMHILLAIIIVVVSLGIASAQLTAVLERRRELAILSALGMKGRQVLALIVLEAMMIGLGGAVVALMAGGAGAHYLATKGVNLAVFMGEEFSFADVLFDPYIYGDFGAWLIGYALGIAEVATVAASLYPAWLAIRVHPADSLRTI